MGRGMRSPPLAPTGPEGCAPARVSSSSLAWADARPPSGLSALATTHWMGPTQGGSVTPPHHPQILRTGDNRTRYSKGDFAERTSE